MEIKREIYSGQELDSKLQKGIDKLANAVKVTMGPKGKLVLIHRPGQHPIVTKDGVTVAQAVNLVDEVENLGAQIIKESASRTADEAGDGTTTATVLAQFIYNEGLKYKIAGFDILKIKEGIEYESNRIINRIKDTSKAVENQSDLLKVATISANGEEEVAKLIVDAIEAAGPDGHVIVEEAKGFNSSLQVVDGFQMERGFLSPYFVTDKNKMTAEFNNPLILMADRNFNSVRELMKPLEIALEMGRPIVIIGNEIEGDAMQGLVLNRIKGSLRVAAIKSPGFGGARHDLLLDLESIVGGKVLDSAFDMTAFNHEMFGTCKKIIIQKSKTLIIREEEKTELSQERIDSIKEQLGYPGIGENESELLKYRLQQLSGGIAILRVGAATESELIERYDRVDDALHATRAALEEGILPGGGIALNKASSYNIFENKESENWDKNFTAGIRIMNDACKEPFKQILKNAGISHHTVLSDIENHKKDNFGYDIRNKKIGDMFELGVLDPAKVARCAIENSVSAATMLLSADCSLIEVNSEQND